MRVVLPMIMIVSTYVTLIVETDFRQWPQDSVTATSFVLSPK